MHNKGPLSSWLGRKSFGVGLSPWQHPWRLYVPGYPEWCLPFSSFLCPLSKPSGTSTVCQRLWGTGPHCLKSLLSPCFGCPWCYEEPNDTVSSQLSQNSQAHTQKSLWVQFLHHFPVFQSLSLGLSWVVEWRKSCLCILKASLPNLPIPRIALVPLVCRGFPYIITSSLLWLL